MIKQWHAAFQPVRHAHAVLDLKQRRQQAFEIEMGHRVEIGLVADVSGLLKIALKRFKDAGLIERVPVDFVRHVARAVDQPEIPAIEVGQTDLREELA